MKQSQRGSALILIIVIFAVLAIIGTAVLNLSLSENKQTIFQENELKSYYAARSGVEAMASYLIGKPDEIENIIDETGAGSIDGRTFKVKVTGSADFVTGRITAPVIESVHESTNGTSDIRVVLQLLERNIFDGVVLADSYLDIGNNNWIKGDLQTNADSITFGNHDVDGDITLGVNASPADIENAEDENPGYEVDKATTPIAFPDIKVSEFTTPWVGGTEFINNSGIHYYTVDTMGGNNTYTISGSGEIHVLVTDSINFSGQGGIVRSSSSDDVRMYIYYAKSDVITFGGLLGCEAALYAPDATVNYNGGGSGGLSGTIICDSFNGPSSNTEFEEDPGLNMNHFMIEGVAGYVRGVYSN